MEQQQMVMTEAAKALSKRGQAKVASREQRP